MSVKPLNLAGVLHVVIFQIGLDFEKVVPLGLKGNNVRFVLGDLGVEFGVLGFQVADLVFMLGKLILLALLLVVDLLRVSAGLSQIFFEFLLVLISKFRLPLVPSFLLLVVAHESLQLVDRLLLLLELGLGTQCPLL